MTMPAGPTAPRSLDVARQAVEAALGGAGWDVRPLGGSTGRTFVATADRTVVVRLDADPAVLRRVAALGVAPEVIASGDVDGRSFVIQVRVAATNPEAADLAAGATDLARLVTRYAADVELASLAAPLRPADAVSDARTRIARLADPTGWRPVLERLEELADTIEPVPPVASHGDPNASNILATRSGLLLVDWDDVRSADPMRDLGQLAWWYLPRPRWRQFVGAAGIRWTREVEARLFWWVASESLDVGLRLAGADPSAARAFRGDAEAALAGSPNPRRPA